MQANWMRLGARRGVSYWLVVLGATAFVSVEPALFLVLLTFALWALVLAWIVMLARMPVVDARIARPQPCNKRNTV